MTIPIFYTGDSRPYPLTLTMADTGETFAINASTDTVKANIIDATKFIPLIESPVTLDLTYPGSDLANSKVIVKFPKGTMDTIKRDIAEAILEIQVETPSGVTGDDPIDKTCRITISIRKGTIA